MQNEKTDYHSLSDTELIAAARGGDSGAYSALVSRYLFVVRKRAANYYSDEFDFDDLMQEGFIGLLNAIRGYDESAPASFSTFARLCIDRSMISAVRRGLRKKQIPRSMLVALGDEDAPLQGGDPEEAVIDKEDLLTLRRRIDKTLSDRERQVLSLYLEGRNYGEIAERLGISQKSVDNALSRLRAKLR